jgi:hypothetical protein
VIAPVFTFALQTTNGGDGHSVLRQRRTAAPADERACQGRRRQHAACESSAHANLAFFSRNETVQAHVRDSSSAARAHFHAVARLAADPPRNAVSANGGFVSALRQV